MPWGGAGTGFPIGAAGLAQIGNLIFPLPSGDTSGNTDGTAINAALASGFTPVLTPGGQYWTNQTILLPTAGGAILSSQRWNGAQINQANGANLDAVIASNGWFNNRGTADNPQSVLNIKVNGNAGNQTGGMGHGIVITSFWNDIHDNTIEGTGGDGLRLSAFNRGGTKITGSAVENHVWRNDVRNAGGYGIRVYDPTASSGQQYTDGWCIDNIIQDPGADGIRIDDGEGWLVQGCHLYGVTQSGIHVAEASRTRVIGNFIETYGGSATAGVYSAIIIGDGVNTFIGSPQPIVVMGNTAFFSNPAPGSTIAGISGVTSSGVTSNVSVTGNALYGNGFFTGISFGNQSVTATTNLAMAGNQVNNWATEWAPPTSGGLNIQGDPVLGSLIQEMSAAPATPVGAGQVYVDATGHLHYLGPGSTDTILAGP